MNTMRIGTRDGRTSFRPGETIDGAIGWELSAAPAAIEVRLFWQTRGKGTTDVTVVDRVRVEGPALQGAHPFQFVAPAEPPSFSGQLVSLIWSLEAVVLRQGPTASLDIVIAPDGREILLGKVNPVVAGRDGRAP